METIRQGMDRRDLLAVARRLGCHELLKDGHVMLRHQLGQPPVVHQNVRRKDAAYELVRWLRRLAARLGRLAE